MAAIESTGYNARVPAKVELDTRQQSLLVDGEPFPWTITSAEIVSKKEHGNTLTVSIPIAEISVQVRR
ncbi:hypothetical protein MHT86_08240 [Corynebacterium mastitidis]|uniref:Uncharacterized protein n=1 Tax=Corynebacterium mastitidis TaxID=161890 RepID=A0A2N0X503_9CORY|nr:hypothetical protein [Corynebacterium mastitidis]MCH6197483.1 hypothetical protein [Corynebacterium mastitidis]PKF67789.1 hypothetical protein CXB45_10405 [Corynebacterium mastitidis]